MTCFDCTGTVLHANMLLFEISYDFMVDSTEPNCIVFVLYCCFTSTVNI